ncbi:dihydroxy-acid dehydratase [Bryobacterales bacterium F-183]|nr:dihydroxy-acid dehydratase [Bryobacterales bacterium F-183]
MSGSSSSNNMPLRSLGWFRGREYYNFSRRANLRSEGFLFDKFEGKPVIGICNSWSELNNCNAHLRQVAEAVRRGVLAAGGFPLEFPTISLGEQYMKPTTMLFRNLMAMDVEESIRANPLDGVVLLCGCDKTTPAQLMGAASADIPAIVVTGGPTLSGNYKNTPFATGTDGRKIFDLYRTGSVSEEELQEIEGCMVRSAGHCTVMGTASTMASIAEALGMTLPGGAAIPAPDSRRLQLAEASGRRMVEMLLEGNALRPTQIMTREAIENAITVNMAIGGSTNAVIHLLAIAGRLGHNITLDDFDRISRITPYLANIRPSGEFLMEDFFFAGGIPAVMRELLSERLHGNCITINGKTIAENVAQAPCHNRAVVREYANPIHPEGGTVVLYGNLAPNGAVLKQTAASPHLLQHKGKAYVFNGHDEMITGVDRLDLPIDKDTVLVMKNAGPKGAPGMPEWGHIPMPKVLLNQGIKDMVRISDARMSGTSFGTVVLHIAPESAIGGPLALVETGDEIELDVAGRKINLNISQEEWDRRVKAFQPAKPHYTRGYGKLFLDHVTQANQGCDFDFLMAEVPSK